MKHMLLMVLTAMQVVAVFAAPEVAAKSDGAKTLPLAEARQKIDGAVAMIMALDRAIRCGCVSDESVYDSREMLIL